MSAYEYLFRPGRIGGMPVRNRIVMPPMASCFGGSNGEVTETMTAYYSERARGGVGLIIVENIQVDYPAGNNIVTQIRCDQDRFLPGLNQLAEACQRYGARIFGQIQHSGRQTAPLVTQGIQPVGASDKPCGFMQVSTRALTTEEVDALVEKFAQGAFRLKRAGFDGVELHAAHGYLIGQFLSPLTNTRSDRYGGGTVRERCRFLLDIIARVRELCSQAFPVSVRFSADEFVEGGIDLGQGIQIAKVLEGAGVNVLHVSCGIYESMCTLLEPMTYPDGWRVYLAEAVKASVSIPVITVGKIRKPSMADDIIRRGQADFVAFGRQLICDAHFPRKAKEGLEEDIIPCLSCNVGCVGGRMFSGRAIRCVLNPVTGREREYAELTPAITRKKVLVLGGGPGGMETARVAALRGHDVTLVEKSAELGGQLNLAKLPPGKEKIEEVRQWFERQCRKAGVVIRLETEATLQLIAEMDPDVVVVATGGKPIVPRIDGIEGALAAVDVLAGKAEVSGSVCIIGGGMIGCETALHLARRDATDIAVIEMLDAVASTVEPMTRIDLLERMGRAGIRQYTGARVIEVKDTGVRCEMKGKHLEIPADAVLYSVGTMAVDSLAYAIEALGKECHRVGDCRDPYKQTQIMDAVHDGGMVGRGI